MCCAFSDVKTLGLITFFGDAFYAVPHSIAEREGAILDIIILLRN